jgi:aminoglycoside phosphotransferase
VPDHAELGRDAAAQREHPATSSSKPGVLVDQQLPGLALLVDDGPLRVWLTAHGEVLERRCYVRYKQGISCVAALRLRSGPAFLLAVSAAAQPKLDKAVLKAPPSAVLIQDPDRRLLLASLTADRDLPAVRDLDDTVTRLLELDPSGHHIETLVYNPQRRWVGVTGRGEQQAQILLRAYRRQEVDDAVERLGVAGLAAGALRVPRLLAAKRRSGLLALDYLPGVSVDVAMAAGSASTDVAAAGEALAKVHQVEAPGALPAKVSRASDTARLVGTLAPGLAERLERVVDTLERHRPSPATPTLCHGDFSLDQVIVSTDEELGLVDWDRAGRGQPAADLASAAAAGLDDPAMEQLLGGYERIRPVPPDLSWHLAHARLQRLAEPFRMGSPSWAAELHQRVTALESALP